MKAAAIAADEKIAEEKRKQELEETKEPQKEAGESVKITQIEVADDFNIDDI
jgi:hypothetical protein